MPQNDLALVPIDELIKELKGRFTHMVITGIIEDGILDTNHYDYKGNLVILSGLCSQMEARINDEVLNLESEDFDDRQD